MRVLVFTLKNGTMNCQVIDEVSVIDKSYDGIRIYTTDGRKFKFDVIYKLDVTLY